MKTYLHLFRCKLASSAKANNQRCGDSTTTNTSFLTTTALYSFQSDSGSTSNINGSNTLGAIKFVAGDTHQIDVHGIHIHGDFADSLSSISVEKDLVLAANLSNFLNGLNDTNFIVDGHDGNNGSIRADSFFELLDVDQSVGLNWEVSDVETFLLQYSARFQNTLVFLSPVMRNFST